jgi:hypothetical protein
MTSIDVRVRDVIRAWFGWIPQQAADLSGDVVASRSVVPTHESDAASKAGLRFAVIAPDSPDSVSAMDKLSAGIASTSYIKCSSIFCPNRRMEEIERHVAHNQEGLPSTIGKLLTCGRCRAAWYCDIDCQRAHWAVHKSACKVWAQKRKGLGTTEGLAIPDSSQAAAFNTCTLTFARASQFFAVLDAAWGTGALLIEMDDAVFASHGPNAANPMRMVISPWTILGPEARPTNERALVRRLRARNVDAGLVMLLGDKKVPSSTAVVYATHSGDLAKCGLVPFAGGYCQVYFSNLPKRHVLLQSLRAVVVEPCVGDTERGVGSTSDSVPALASCLLQPSNDIGTPGSAPCRFCVVFGVK